MASLIDNVASALQRAGRWLQEHGGSKQFTVYRWPSMTESSNTKVDVAVSAKNPLNQEGLLLSITCTRPGSQAPYEVFSASFVTSESSALEALSFSSKLPHTSLTRLRCTPSIEL